MPKSQQAFAPLQLVQVKKQDLNDDNVPVLNQQLTQIINRVNALSGHAGPVTIQSSIDLSGNQISNLGKPQAASDAVSLAHAEASYGPANISRQLAPNGSHPVQGVRRLNDNTQSENFSTFLNGTLNVAPTGNTSEVTYATPSGGSVMVTVSSGFANLVDGKTVIAYAMRSDTLSLPSTVTIASLVRSGGVVTATTSGPHGLTVGETVYISSADTTFVGSFRVATTPTSNTFTYLQTAPDDPVAISVSLSRAANVVTATTSVPNPYTTGQSVTISAAVDTSFNGTFGPITVINPTTFTYAQTAANATTTATVTGIITGTSSTGSVYYYFLNKSDNSLVMTGPYDADNATNRVNANIDGTAQVAVVVLSSGGVVPQQSGGGGTPAAQTGGHTVSNRLA